MKLFGAAERDRLAHLERAISTAITTGDVADAYPLIPERNALREWRRNTVRHETEQHFSALNSFHGLR
jgi:hypothetical protein